MKKWLIALSFLATTPAAALPVPVQDWQRPQQEKAAEYEEAYLQYAALMRGGVSPSPAVVWTTLPMFATAGGNGGTCGTNGTLNRTCVVYAMENGTGTLSGASSCVVPMPSTGPDANFPTPCDPVVLGSNAVFSLARTASNAAISANNINDWIVTKCGSRFNYTATVAAGPVLNGAGFLANNAGSFRSTGFSSAAPLVIAPYGDCVNNPPPITDPGSGSAFSSNAAGGGNIAIVGQDFYHSVNDPTSPTYTAPLTVTATSCGASPGGCTNGAFEIEFASIPATLKPGMNLCVLRSALCTNTGNTVVSKDAIITAITGNKITISLGVVSGQTVQIGDVVAFANNNTGFTVNSTALNYVLFEGNRVRFSSTNQIKPSGGVYPTNPTILVRYNVISNVYALTGNASGFFLDDMVGPASCQDLSSGTIIFEGNVFDANGQNTGPAYDWVDAVKGASGSNLNHNVYVHDCSPPAIFRKNISARAATTGVQLRPGGTLYNNLLLNNALGYLVYTGFQNSPAVASYNVVLSAKDVESSVMTVASDCAPPCSALVMTDPIWSGSVSAGNAPRNITPGNEGSLNSTKTVVSAPGTGNTVNLSGAVVSTVFAGDRIKFVSQNLGQGSAYQLCGGYAVSATAPLGATVLHFAYLAPNVVPGMSVRTVEDKPTIFQASTTVLSVDRTNPADVLVTIDKATGLANPTLLGGGWAVQFYDLPTSSPSNAFCSVQVANNIFSKQTEIYNTNGQAMRVEAGTQFYSFSNNWIIPGSFAYPNTTAAWSVTITESNSPTTSIYSNNMGNTGTYTTTFSPVGTPTIEQYDSAVLGGPGTINHFMDCAKTLSRYNVPTQCMAPAVNNWMRAQTDPSIPLQ